MVHTMVSIAARAMYRRWLQMSLIDELFDDETGKFYCVLTEKGRALIAQMEGRA